VGGILRGFPQSLIDTPSEEKAASGSSNVGPPISGAEVAEVVKKLLGGKAPGSG